MTAPKGPGPLPWIRTKETIRLIEGECGGDQAEMERRLLDALSHDLVRCQAGSARFQLPSGSELKRNWPVPRYIWEDKGGALSLSDDRFTAMISLNCSAAIAKDFGMVGVQSVMLLELKIHKGELQKHFQLLARTKREPASKVKAIQECKGWLPKEFEKDKDIELRKEDFAQKARSKFGDKLSGRGFDEAWKAVTSDPAHAARAARGRPKGT